MNFMKLRYHSVITGNDQIWPAFEQGPPKAGERRQSSQRIDMSNPGHVGQRMSGGAKSLHRAAMPDQCQCQSSRQGPPFGGHQQHGRVRFARINHSLNSHRNRFAIRHGHLNPPARSSNCHRPQFAEGLKQPTSVNLFAILGPGANVKSNRYTSTRFLRSSFGTPACPVTGDSGGRGPAPFYWSAI